MLSILILKNQIQSLKKKIYSLLPHIKNYFVESGWVALAENAEQLKDYKKSQAVNKRGPIVLLRHEFAGFDFNKTVRTVYKFFFVCFDDSVLKKNQRFYWVNLHQSVNQGQSITTSQHKIPDPETIYYSNMSKLWACFRKADKILLLTFIREWNLRSERKWKNDLATRFKFCICGPGRKLFRLKEENKYNLLGLKIKMTEWSTPALRKSLQCLGADAPYHIFEKLEALQCKLVRLSHFRLPPVPDELFADFYKRTANLLLEIDAPLEEIDRFKPVFAKPINIKTVILPPEIENLKCLGDAALKIGNFQDAIKFYTDALCDYAVSGLCNRRIPAPLLELPLLYIKRSDAYREVNNIVSAEKDAKHANYFSNLEFRICENIEELEADKWDDKWELEFELDGNEKKDFRFV